MKDILTLSLCYTVACLVVLLEIIMFCSIIFIPLLLALRNKYTVFCYPFGRMSYIWESKHF